MDNNEPKDIELLTQKEVCDHLGIEISELDEITKRNIEKWIRLSDIYLQGSVGKNYLKTDERAKELALFIINDLYENRGQSENVSINTRKLVNDMSLQLKLELKAKCQ